MQGTQCDQCKRMQTRDEYLRPVASGSQWLDVQYRSGAVNLNFCSYVCVINYFQAIVDKMKEG